MIDSQKNIRERCHVNQNSEGDSFVGVKADTDDAIIYFPIGYHLPENDDDLRVDIHNLFGILAEFMEPVQVLESSKFATPVAVNFPMHSYLKVIRNFLRHGRYYVETDPQFRTDAKGNVSWSRTVREQRALIQKSGSLIFTNMTVRSVTPNASKQITQIHRYCVYEAFEKLGWLYVPFMPEKPGVHPCIKESIHILTKKLATTHNDVEQELFGAMCNMLVYIDEKSDEKQDSFGTDYFERVWECMIDKAFGVADKKQFFPKTRWLLDYGNEKDRVKKPLCPDSIMVYEDKYYVLDAKLYRYGCSFDPAHLPNGSDIYKQITYGEYIEHKYNIPNDKIYNAFIMPFNKEDNQFKEMDEKGNPVPKITGNIRNIGESVGEWKNNIQYYERIQGIVMDTRYIMYNYIGTSDQQRKELAECIEKVRERNPVPEPHEFSTF